MHGVGESHAEITRGPARPRITRTNHAWPRARGPAWVDSPDSSSLLVRATFASSTACAAEVSSTSSNTALSTASIASIFVHILKRAHLQLELQRRPALAHLQLVHLPLLPQEQLCDPFHCRQIGVHIVHVGAGHMDPCSDDGSTRR